MGISAGFPEPARPREGGEVVLATSGSKVGGGGAFWPLRSSSAMTGGSCGVVGCWSVGLSVGDGVRALPGASLGFTPNGLGW